jgi:hypothetical protein
MNDTDYVKCSCQKCGEHIEFPPGATGQLIDCPHCGAPTKLISNLDQSQIKSGKKFAALASLILVIIILVAAGMMFYFPTFRPRTQGVLPANATPTTNLVLPDGFIELNDFQISKITLKKAENGGLVNAVGTVKNETARQRFGVKVTLDLLDSQHEKVGTARDYIAILEPHQEWQFRALLNEPKAIDAKLAGIEEEK